MDNVIYLYLSVDYVSFIGDTTLCRKLQFCAMYVSTLFRYSTTNVYRFHRLYSALFSTVQQMCIGLAFAGCSVRCSVPYSKRVWVRRLFSVIRLRHSTVQLINRW